MRRFACQRLYLSPDTYFIRYVVELGNNGKIQRYYPLEEEIYAMHGILPILILSEKNLFLKAILSDFSAIFF